MPTIQELLERASPFTGLSSFGRQQQAKRKNSGFEVGEPMTVGEFLSTKIGEETPWKESRTEAEDIANLRKRLADLPLNERFVNDPGAYDSEAEYLAARLRAMDTPALTEEQYQRQQPEVPDIKKLAQTMSPAERIQPGIGEFPGKEGMVPKPGGVQPQQAPVPEQPQPGGMTPERRAMLLRILSGLTSAGRRLADVPTLADVRYGAGTQRPFKPETEMLGEAKRIEGEQRERTEGVESPLVSAWNKIARERGLKEATTERQAAAGFDALGLGEKVKTLEAKRGAVEAEAKSAEDLQAALQQKRESGKLSDLSPDAKDELSKTEKNLTDDDTYKKYSVLAEQITQLRKMLEEGGELAYKSAPVILARAMGEVGNLSRTDLEFYKKNLGIKGEITNWLEYFQSQEQPERLEAMEKLIASFEASAAPKIRDVVNRYAEGFTRKYDEIPKEEVVDHFMSFGVSEAVKDIEGGVKGRKETIGVRGSDGKKYQLPKAAKPGDTFKVKGQTITVEEILG